MSKVGDIFIGALWAGHVQFVLITIEEEEKNTKNDTN
jgi:hypothetical protein